MAKTAGKKPAGLEEAMARLEELVGLMNGECTIDQSIAFYTEAVKLVEYAEERLTTARQQVDKLMAVKEEQHADI